MFGYHASWPFLLHILWIPYLRVWFFFFFLFCLFLLGNLYLSYQFVRTLNINNINLLPYMWQVSLFWHFKIKARKFYFFFLCDLHLLYFAFCKPVRLSFVIDVPLCFEEFLLQLAKPACRPYPGYRISLLWEDYVGSKSYWLLFVFLGKAELWSLIISLFCFASFRCLMVQLQLTVAIESISG